MQQISREARPLELSKWSKDSPVICKSLQDRRFLLPQALQLDLGLLDL